MLGLAAVAAVLGTMLRPTASDAGKVRWVMELAGLSEFTCPMFHEVLADRFIGTDGVQRLRWVDRSLNAAPALNVWWVSVLARGAVLAPSCPQEITTVFCYCGFTVVDCNANRIANTTNKSSMYCVVAPAADVSSAVPGFRHPKSHFSNKQ